MNYRAMSEAAPSSSGEKRKGAKLTTAVTVEMKGKKRHKRYYRRSKLVRGSKEVTLRFPA